MTRTATSLLVLCALAATAGAEPEPRPLHWSLHAGGFGAVTGPADGGPMAAVSVSPGGRFGRFGASVRWRGFEGVADGWVVAGWTYEAGAARPRLVISFHGEAGLTYGAFQCPVAGGGIESRLHLVGPLFVGADGGAHLVYDGVDSRLAFSAGLVLGLGR